MDTTIGIIETALLLLIVFLIGCVIGWLLKTYIFADAEDSSANSAAPDVDNASPLGATKVESVAAPSPVKAASAPKKPAAAKSAKPAAAKTVKPAAAKTAKPAAAAKTAKPVAAKTAKPAAAKAAKPVAAKTAKPVAAKTAKPAAAAKTAKPAAAAKTAKPAKSADAGRPAALSAARAGGKDDLKVISGVGPKIESTLNGLGIFHYDQIATWKKAEIDWVDGYLNFKGRIQRDKWVAQAKKLSK